MTLAESGNRRLVVIDDIPARPLDGLGQDLTVLQDHKLRIDIDTAAAACAVQNRRADRAIGELHRAVGGRGDLDRPAARLVGLRRHRAIRHRELVAGIDRDVPGIAAARARGRNRSSIAELNRGSTKIDVATRTITDSGREEAASLIGNGHWPSRVHSDRPASAIPELKASQLQHLTRCYWRSMHRCSN